MNAVYLNLISTHKTLTSYQVSHKTIARPIFKITDAADKITRKRHNPLRNFSVIRLPVFIGTVTDPEGV